MEPVGGGHTTALAMQTSFYGTESTWVPGWNRVAHWPILGAMSIWLKVILIGSIAAAAPLLKFINALLES